MAEELETLWQKLSLIEEEDENIVLGSSSTKALKELGKNCPVMKILSCKSIMLDALRKNLRMIWKPSKGVQIMEIKDEMYMVEFGDGKNKKKVLEMSPWSYEKQLILLHDFEGEQAPKEISLTRSHFWIRIYNLPLKSKTRETSWAISETIGKVGPRMIWKPSKGVQIMEIKDEMFMVEFGDGKNKKKVLEMSPWSYEKQLILLHDFEGEQAPKEISLTRSPFWIQIYNLPLKSKTRETSWAISETIGKVMEVDIVENGV
nr:hypothetical protein CFP56_08682 [Quercus suber]